MVLDKKGNPVRQHEPYFSSTEAYEAEAELREQGGSVKQLGYDDGSKLYSVSTNVRGAMTTTDFVTTIE